MSGITQDWRCWCSSFVIWGVLIASLQECVIAQITPDGTLPNNSSITRDGNIFNITGGTQAGSNLFHSFGEFSVPNDGTASFNNAGDIQNIISRVTGGSVSNIDGLIRANNTANLFLINPNGIIFGRNASLNIGGSFVATTVNAIGFDNQGFFSADNPNTPELLTVNPSALLFNQIRATSIQNNSVADSGLNPSSEFTATGLRVPDGRSLLLVGGDINMDGGGLFAFGGRVELGGLAGAGTVGLNSDGNNLNLSFPDGVERSDVFLSNRAVVYVAAGDGGSVAVNAKNLKITGGSSLSAGIGIRQGFNNNKAGNIDVNATGAINLNGSSIQNQVLAEATGQGGDINISASTLKVQGGAQVSTATFSSGKGGNIRVDTQDIQLMGESADGKALSALGTTTEPNSTGDAGNLAIKTNTLLVRDGAQVITSTFGLGRGGDLTVNAQDVQLIGTITNGQTSSGLFASADLNLTGDAGDLTIKTNTLLVRDGAQVITATFGSGKGGNLTVDAQDVQLIGKTTNGQFVSGLFVSADLNSIGNAGDLTIKTNTLLVRDGAQVVTGTFSSGKGGNLTVEAQDVQLIGTIADGQFVSGLFASTAPNSTGNAGNLTIKTNTLLVRDGAAVTAQSLGTGTAGNMTVNTRSLRLNNNALLSSNTRSAKIDPYSEQATININSENLIMSGNSNIFTNATGENVIGGNINIDTDILVGFENSDISANSANFRGGNVRINAQSIFGIQFRDMESDRKSDITATGVNPESSGNVELNTRDIDPNSGLVELPAIPVDTEVAQGCYSPGYAQSSFVITGRGGLPGNPKDILTPDAVQIDWVSVKPRNNNRSLPPVTSKLTTSTPKRIVEATGAMLNAKGQIVLSANSSTATPHTSRQNPIQCNGR